MFTVLYFFSFLTSAGIGIAIFQTNGNVYLSVAVGVLVFLVTVFLLMIVILLDDIKKILKRLPPPK